MIIDPMEVLKTSRAILPTATPTNVVPIPSIVPPSPSYEHAHQSGKTTLWVVFVLMVITSAAFAAMSWRIPVSRRVYHVITTTMVIISSLAYFGMATGHGASYKHITVRHSHDHVPDTYDHVYRQVFWARYIDWALTTPLILLNLGLLAGLNGGYILMAILANVVMDLTGMFAAFSTVGTQRWGWFIIAIISYLVVIWHLVLNGRAHARAKGDKVNTFFTSITAFTVIVWTAYPIIWQLAPAPARCQWMPRSSLLLSLMSYLRQYSVPGCSLRPPSFPSRTSNWAVSGPMV
jgi:bacteriorhodopsin